MRSSFGFFVPPTRSTASTPPAGCTQNLVRPTRSRRGRAGTRFGQARTERDDAQRGQALCGSARTLASSASAAAVDVTPAGAHRGLDPARACAATVASLRKPRSSRSAMSDHIQARCCSARSAASSPEAVSVAWCSSTSVPQLVEPGAGLPRDGERARGPARRVCAAGSAAPRCRSASASSRARRAVAVGLVDRDARRPARARPS